MKHPLYRHSENLSKSGPSMGVCESLLGGLPNLGKMAKLYQSNHHLLQLIETDSILKATYENEYSSGEVKAYADGATSILKKLEECLLEVTEKNVSKKEEE
ncbi:MAG: hypothetical protein KAS32_27550 [Candidatus Peribacteraceae bacterium]|nr:hypothetical protein [Candidatus Peribacteraceae bacterium]